MCEISLLIFFDFFFFSSFLLKIFSRFLFLLFFDSQSSLAGSLIPINKQFVPLIFLAISTMCGNIMFPILLRFLVYLHLHISKWLKNDDQVSVLKLILKSPRQVCFLSNIIFVFRGIMLIFLFPFFKVSTHLFPRSDTYMLLVVTLTVLTFETFLLLATDYDNKLAFGDLSGTINGDWKCFCFKNTFF